MKLNTFKVFPKPLLKLCQGLISFTQLKAVFKMNGLRKSNIFAV